MKKLIIISLIIIFSEVNSFAGILGDCTNKRFSREMEFLLMYNCMSSTNFMDKNKYQDKLGSCTCYVGSLACEFDGDDDKLFSAYRSNKKLNNDKKKYQKCSEKKDDFDETKASLTVEKAIDDAN